MKPLVGILAALLVLTLSACKDDPAKGSLITQPAVSMPTGTIDGEFTLPPTATGPLDHIQVAIYKSDVDLRTRQPAKVVQTDVKGEFVITGVCCGQYYIDAWKDIDGDGTVSAGDYYLVYANCYGACQCTVQEGSAVNFSGTLSVVH